MGNRIPKLFTKTKKEFRILLLGLDNAGKSTIIYTLKQGTLVNTVPTIGFNVETIIYNNVEFTVFDVGGQEQIRSLWRHYFKGTQGLIYVIDSYDRERFEEAKRELNSLLLDPQLSDAVCLIFANKCDLPKAMSAVELEQALEISRNHKSRIYRIQESSALQGEGLVEGFCWLEDALSNLEKKKKKQAAH